MRSLVRDLAFALREQVLPSLRAHGARAHEHNPAAGGDVTFAIDAAAEELLERFIAERAPDVAFYSEDRGMVLPGGGREARAVLVVDPIDGTRPALAGLESCCVSIAAVEMYRCGAHPINDRAALLAQGGSRCGAHPMEGSGARPIDDRAALLPDRAALLPGSAGPTMGDVSVGCVLEIPSGTLFLAERGAGLLEAPPVRLSPNERLDRMFWAYGFRGRPARPTTEVLAELIDASSVGGGTFDLGSAAFDMTRVVTGQLDAYVEPGPRMVADVPEMREQFERVGNGAVLNNSPHDLAASVLVLEEAGAIVTDAYGGSLADRPLLGSSAAFQMSVVASSNATLHASILREVDAGIARLSG